MARRRVRVRVDFVESAKLFLFHDSELEVKGLGDVKLLLDKKDDTVSVLLRQESTLTTVGNFYIKDSAFYCQLKPHNDSENALVWWCIDCSHGEPKAERHVLTFAPKQMASKDGAMASFGEV